MGIACLLLQQSQASCLAMRMFKGVYVSVYVLMDVGRKQLCKRSQAISIRVASMWLQVASETFVLKFCSAPSPASRPSRRVREAQALEGCPRRLPGDFRGWVGGWGCRVHTMGIRV